MIDHISIQCADPAASAAFYDRVLAPLGGERVLDFGEVIGYGVPPKPNFWVGPRASGDGFRESHIAFTAATRSAVDAFIVYTDNETWAGNIHPYQALEQYRREMGIPAKLVVVGMTATEFSIANPDDAGMLDVVGFDTAAPAVMADFIRA